MPFDGLSAASAPEAINKTKHTKIKRGSILDTSDETPVPGTPMLPGVAR